MNAAPITPTPGTIYTAPIGTQLPTISDTDLADLERLGTGDVLRCRLLVVHETRLGDIEDPRCERPAVWMMRLSCTGSPSSAHARSGS